MPDRNHSKHYFVLNEEKEEISAAGSSHQNMDHIRNADNLFII
jgi:hypothetical protein